MPKRFVSTPEDRSKDGLRHVVVQLKTTMGKVQIRLRNASNHLQEPTEFNSLHFYLGTATSSVVSQTNVHNIITHCCKLCFNIMLRPAPESKESATQRVQYFFLAGKRLWPKVEHSPTSNAEIKSGAIPPNPVIRHYGVDRDKFASSLQTNPLNFICIRVVQVDSQ